MSFSSKLTEDTVEVETDEKCTKKQREAIRQQISELLQ